MCGRWTGLGIRKPLILLLWTASWCLRCLFCEGALFTRYFSTPLSSLPCQISTGNNLGSWFAHYKAVSSLALTSCCSVLVSGGEDAVAHAWTVAECVQSDVAIVVVFVLELDCWR